MIRSLLVLPLLGALAFGQCTATFQSYGSACGTAFPGATLTGSFDASNCTLSLTLDAFPGCCNTFSTGNVWAFGNAPTQVPIPGTPGCLVLNTAEVVLLTPTAQNVISAVIPPAISGFTVYAQAARTYFTTIGFTEDLSLTAGLQITF